ncbi:unnamed protein product [Arctia plantaginis]|uniref:V-SNARE coiled-coil homology domain-containing protein n=1 Tax=Arctia plantaginis TaxID=874455 RepID=A0A8S0ZLB5_ARCPL|nr:unnamed protein product [Arctia plantaginis]
MVKTLTHLLVENHLPLRHKVTSTTKMAAEGKAGGLTVAEPEVGPDGEIIGGPRTPQQIAAQRRLQQSQAQVDEVVDIMKTNMDKVLDRDVKLSELDDRADALQQGASQFEQQAKSLKNKFWLQNLKMMIIMGVIGIVIIGLLFGDNIKQMFG